MKNKQAFTLIELLVVVLIIGILAAVALPQYQLAVEKSRASEALTNLRAIVNAEEVYKMANGQATNQFDELDISIGTPSGSDVHSVNFRYHLVKTNSGRGYEAAAYRLHNNNDLRQYYIYRAFNGILHCVAQTQSAKKICYYLSQGKGGTPSGTNTYYVIEYAQ